MSDVILENVAIIILAAGLGTRMNSDKAKVLHEINGKPMIHYVLETTETLNRENIIVVVGYQSEKVKDIVSKIFNVQYALQKDQLGTGHAVKVALPYLKTDIQNVIILCGDVPLIREKTLINLIKQHSAQKNDISLIATKLENPAGYGRIIFGENSRIINIVEEKDASEIEKKIDIINTGVYCINREFLDESIPKIQIENQQKEYYLTDIINIGYRGEKKSER